MPFPCAANGTIVHHSFVCFGVFFFFFFFWFFFFFFFLKSCFARTFRYWAKPSRAVFETVLQTLFKITRLHLHPGKFQVHVISNTCYHQIRNLCQSLLEWFICVILGSFVYLIVSYAHTNIKLRINLNENCLPAGVTWTCITRLSDMSDIILESRTEIERQM